MNDAMFIIKMLLTTSYWLFIIF